MPPVRRERLRELCASADDETLAGFVAAVYAARGHAVSHEEGPVFTHSGTRGAERIAVAGTPAAGAADTLVTAGRTRSSGDADTVDVDRLWTWLRYAVGAETATTLVREWFGDDALADDTDEEGRETATETQNGRGSSSNVGRTAQSEGPPTRTSTGRSARLDERLFRAVDTVWTARRARIGAVGVAVVLAVVGLTVLGGLPGGPASGAGLGTEQRSTELTPVGNVTTPTPVATGQSDGSIRPGTLPPGVGPSGITDAMRLANAHEAQVGPQSFRATLVYREFENGRAVGTSIQTARVADDTAYRTSRTDLGDVAGGAPTLTEGDVYANGSARFVQTDTGVRQEPLGDDAPYVDRVEQLHRWYLSVETSRITNQTASDGLTSTWLHVDGDSWVGVEDLRGTVLVTETGVVTLVRRSYRDPDTGRRVVVTLRVSDVGSTAVAPPAWL